ncbi:MAG TPA: YceI family protein [Pseudonocardiaceae bacterium]|jgi:polyisoprenoid-binding protein YceI|nr:YceI family protein [Pseudonocardiaceae bacterium]
MSTPQSGPGGSDWFDKPVITPGPAATPSGAASTASLASVPEQASAPQSATAQASAAKADAPQTAAPQVPPSVPADEATGVTAIVQTSDGWPVPGAVLTVTDANGQQVARVGAEVDGRLATKPLPQGNYTAIITAAGFDPAARTALVTGSGSAVLGMITLPRVAGTELPPAGTWTIDPMHSTIYVTARHLGFATVRGRFGEFSGKIEVGNPIEQSRVTALIEAASIDTGNKMRDDHMRSADFLGVDVHPVIQYVGTNLTQVGGEKWRLDGRLTLNGTTRPVALDLTYLGVGPDPWGGTRAAFHAVTDLKRDDFAMNYNPMIRVGVAAVGTTLRVELDIEAVLGDGLPAV